MTEITLNSQDKEKLAEVYIGKFWYSSDRLMILIPKELETHKDFPLKIERTLVLKPVENGLLITNVKAP